MSGAWGGWLDSLVGVRSVSGRAKAVATAVYSLMVEEAKHPEAAGPTRERVADHAGMTLQELDRVVAELVAYGALRCSRRAGADGCGATVYELLEPPSAAGPTPG